MPNPRVYIIAGPNGAGKTTFAMDYLLEEVEVEQFVNADEIAKGLSPLKPERVAIRAGRLCLEEIDRLAARQADFAFETTLSGKAYLPRLKQWKGIGYRIELYFLWPGNLATSIARVIDRVRHGGHNIPEEDIRRRFARSIRNFFRDYRHLADYWVIYDTSAGLPATIAYEDQGSLQVVAPAQYLSLIEISEAP